MAFDKDIPASSTSLRASNPQILANQSALETALGANHDFTTGSTQTGRHNDIELLEQADIGTGAVGVTILGSQTTSGKGELVYTNEGDNDVQLTTDDNIGGSHVELLAGKDLLGSATSDITINTNKFTVAGATGNTVIAGTASVGGTLDVTGNIDPTTYETTNGGFLDEDNMASDAADKVASQQSIKKYVDDQVGASAFGARTNEDDEANAMIATNTYLANQDGFVNVAFSVTGAAGIAAYCRAFVHSADPATGGNMMDRWEDTTYHTNATKGGLGAIPVANGQYFAVTVSNVSIVAIYWTPAHGTLVKPSDQD